MPQASTPTEEQQSYPAPTSWLNRLFSVDLRSLAAMRIALGVVILTDILFQRWPALHAHYAGGVISLEVLSAKSASVGWFWSFHQWFSTPLGLNSLFALQSLLAIALILGWRTWLMTPLNWLLLASLQAANFYVLDGGDALLRMLLLFGCFLPLGARWSCDARRGSDYLSPTLPTAFQPSAACLILQVASAYWFSLFFKTDAMWTTSFDALYYAFHYPLYAKGLARHLQEFPLLLKCLTAFAITWEFIGPALVLMAWRLPRLRMIGILLFWGFHAAIFLTFGIELLSFTCMAAWLIFVPTEFWEKISLAQKAQKPEHRERPKSRMIPFAQACAVGLFLLSLAGNAMTTQGKSLKDMPAPLNQIGTAFMLNQNWSAFSNESALSLQVWLSIDGQTHNGDWMNLMTGELASDSVPTAGRDYYPNERWRRATLMLAMNSERENWARLSQYYAKTWNAKASPEQQVSQVRFVLYIDKTEPPGEEPVDAVRRYLKYQANVD